MTLVPTKQSKEQRPRWKFNPKLQLKNGELTADEVLKTISELLLASMFIKMFANLKKHGIDVPTKFNFYVSVFFAGKLLRSRVLNYKGQKRFIRSKATAHDNFFQQHGKNPPGVVVFRRTDYADGEHATCLLRFGDYII